MGKSTISMAIFNSFLYVHQRVGGDCGVKTKASMGIILGLPKPGGHPHRRWQVVREVGAREWPREGAQNGSEHPWEVVSMVAN